MAIEIREFVGAESIFFNQAESDNIYNGSIQLTEWHADDMIDPESVMVDIEGIHSIITRNYTYYTPECLKDSIPYWTRPYEIPVIMHHKERDGITIGRIKAAEYTDKQTRSGTPAVIFTVNIPDAEGKKAIKNGTLSTVSIGAIAHDVKCSICGTNLAEQGLCEHEKGESYEGKLCYWIINKIEPKELSYVIVPSDKYAHNLRVYKPTAYKTSKVVEELLNQSEVRNKMFENPFADIQVVESTEEKETTINTTEEVEQEVEKVESTQEDVKIDEEVKDQVKEETQENDEETKVETETEIEETKNSTEEKEESVSEDKPEEKIKSLEQEIETLKTELNKLHKKVESEKKLRESAETELMEFRLAKKKNLIESVNALRAELNLEKEDETVLMESTEEHLSLTLKNLKEFTNVSKNILNIPKIESNAAVSEDMDNTSKTKQVKEEVEKTDIDFMEETIKIFNKFW